MLTPQAHEIAEEFLANHGYISQQIRIWNVQGAPRKELNFEAGTMIYENISL
jgi:hypothetical protein